MKNLVILLASCQFKAATVVKDDTGSVSNNGGGASDDTSTGAVDTGSGSQDSGNSDAHPSDIDDDLDGYTENDGDCDDSDASVYPGATDDCDGIDSDCDGDPDDDAIDDDIYEPNDEDPYDLGSINDQGTMSITARLHNDDDADWFTVAFEDDWWSWFTFSMALSNIPDDATYRLLFKNPETGETQDEFGSGSLELQVDDTLFSGDSATWWIGVESLGGADCASDYLLVLTLEE